MHIFLTLSPSGNRSVPGSMTWYRNLYEPLLDLSHDVYLLGIDEAENKLGVNRKSKSFQGKFSQYLLNTFQEENIKKPFDLFFSYFIDSDIETSCIDEIKKYGVPTANFSCNNIHQFYLTKKIAPHFDYNLHSEKDAGEQFKATGANPVWFQMAANPTYYHPIEGLERQIDVSFVGQNYAKRAYYIWHLLENGVDVHVYGPGWRQENLGFLRKLRRRAGKTKLLIQYILSSSCSRRAELSSRISEREFRNMLFSKYKDYLHSPISDEEMIRKYSESKISLGFLEVYDNHNPSAIVKQHVHLREFEAPMCGALYFTNYCTELEEFYEPDKEVIVYRNEHELLDKIGYFLSHPGEAQRVRRAGHKRAVECHTYQKRFKDLLKEVGSRKMSSCKGLG